ncbi:MAG: metalloregulator ArsR/SmtB family transcription factor [Pseudomonadota bacterium]
MNITESLARSLAALGHETRLDIFRLLVRAGVSGMTVGQIGAHLDMPPSTLAHHLRSLVDGGLVLQTRQGREVINAASYNTMNAIIDYLTDQCCVGVDTQEADRALSLANTRIEKNG